MADKRLNRLLNITRPMAAASAASMAAIQGVITYTASPALGLLTMATAPAVFVTTQTLLKDDDEPVINTHEYPLIHPWGCVVA